MIAAPRAWAIEKTSESGSIERSRTRASGEVHGSDALSRVDADMSTGLDRQVRKPASISQERVLNERSPRDREYYRSERRSGRGVVCGAYRTEPQRRGERAGLPAIRDIS